MYSTHPRIPANIAPCHLHENGRSFGVSPRETELAQGKSPELVKDLSITLPPEWVLTPSAVVRCYDPWADVWSEGKVEGGKLLLPAFARSFVVRIER